MPSSTKVWRYRCTYYWWSYRVIRVKFHYAVCYRFFNELSANYTKSVLFQTSMGNILEQSFTPHQDQMWCEALFKDITHACLKQFPSWGQFAYSSLKHLSFPASWTSTWIIPVTPRLIHAQTSTFRKMAFISSKPTSPVKRLNWFLITQWIAATR